jgi:hypothetical protein
LQPRPASPSDLIAPEPVDSESESEVSLQPKRAADSSLDAEKTPSKKEGDDFKHPTLF